jgi:hypothetical protein
MSQTLTLRELADEARALDELVWMDEGEWTDATQALYEEHAAALADKADGFGTYVASLTAHAEVVKAEADRLTAMAKRLTGHADALKRYALAHMERMGRTEIPGELYTLKIQRNPPSVQVTVLPDALPAEFVRVIPEQREADKKALLTALKGGAAIDGVTLVQTTRLVIR